MKLHLWKDILWNIDETQTPIARCPEHRIELDIVTEWGPEAQASVTTAPHYAFLCPTDKAQFPVDGTLWDMQRRFKATLDALHLKDADIVSLDGYQVPIAKTRISDKDTPYWVEARINDTKRGKQLVVYAGRRGSSDKSQIFIDTENDKITFDQNNIHPSDVFTKLSADFHSGKKATLESESID